MSALAQAPTAEALAHFWAGPGASLPLVEECAVDGEVLVTFCWRDDHAGQVLLFANRLADETNLAASLLSRIPGTDVWHLTYRLGADWRGSYSFLTAGPGDPAPWDTGGDHVALRSALDGGRPDPRNPDTCVNRSGVTQSVAALPAAPGQPWLSARTEVMPGTVEATRLPDGRRAWLHRPAGCSADSPLPLLVVLDGEVWLGSQALPVTLDNLAATHPHARWHTVFVESQGIQRRWRELSADGGGLQHVVDVVEWAGRRCEVVPGPRHVTVAGQSLGALTALRCALGAGSVVGNAVAHSASLWQDPLTDVLAEFGRGPADGFVHLSHGAQEWVLAPEHDALARRMRAAGMRVEAHTYNGGHDYACWRGGIAEGLLGVASYRNRPA